MLKLILLIVGTLLLLNALIYLLFLGVASAIVYDRVMCRRKKEKWKRNDVDPEPNHVAMDKVGMEWYHANADKKTDVHLFNREGMSLFGEYFDFGADRCAVILVGRPDTLRYGYYFAIPYQKAGYNVFLFDPRAHGWSDGTYTTGGFAESLDVLDVIQFLQTRYAPRSVILHGVCVGSAAGLLAITNESCPDGVDALVADGMYTTFGESLKNHLAERKKNLPFLYGLIRRKLKRRTGYDMNRGPIDHLAKMKKPILMLYSREDRYSLPVDSQIMFDLIPAKEKRLVWFDHGGHSMLRITDPARYDGAILEFLNNLQK